MVDRAQLDRFMAAAADGDRGALDPLFAALWEPVLAYATRFLGGDATLAEDVTQETLVRLFGQLDRYDRERDALTWAFAHATWQCRTARRRVQRRAEVDAVVERISDGAALVEERELARAALDAVNALAPRDVEVIVAAIADDDELRRMLKPATFRKRLERALGRLRLSWRSRHGTL
jgi:RNA polymerase sigma-70 factor (ECF subfamily)